LRESHARRRNPNKLEQNGAGFSTIFAIPQAAQSHLNYSANRTLQFQYSSIEFWCVFIDAPPHWNRIMQQFRQASAGARQQRFAPKPVMVPRSSFDRRNRDRISALRQVEEFSLNLTKMRRAGYISACALLVFTFVCVVLFLRDVDVIAFFSAGAAVLLVQIAMAGSDYFHEEKRAAERYWNYLDNYSYQVLMALRQTCRLSDWSRYEIDKYLAAPRLEW
jgi:hypothetical protein